MITLFDCGIGPNDIIIRWDKKGGGWGLGEVPKTYLQDLLLQVSFLLAPGCNE